MWKTLGKALKVVVFLGALACIITVAVLLFGLKFDKHDFIHSEISTSFSFLLLFFEPEMHAFEREFHFSFLYFVFLDINASSCLS